MAGIGPMQADPEDLPGMVVLMESYINRMETTIGQWYNNIITADLQVGPFVCCI